MTVFKCLSEIHGLSFVDGIITSARLPESNDPTLSSRNAFPSESSGDIYSRLVEGTGKEACDYILIRS
jgi:hypothetical protein